MEHEKSCGQGNCRAELEGERESPDQTDEEEYQVWESVTVDLKGPIGRDRNKKTWLIVLMDRASKWIEVGFLRRIVKKKEVNEFYDRVFGKLGFPETVQTDRRCQLIGKITAEYFKLKNVRHLTKMRTFPEDELPEEMDRELIRMIEEVDFVGKEVQKSLQRRVEEYRNTPLREIGMTPFEKMFNRRKRETLEVETEVREGTAESDSGRELATRSERRNELCGAGQHTLVVGDLVRFKKNNDELTKPQRIAEVFNEAVVLENGYMWPVEAKDSKQSREEGTEGGNVVRMESPEL